MFLILEKYRELKSACQTISKNLTPFDQRTAVPGTIEFSRQIYNVRRFCGTNCFALNCSGKPVTKISWSSMKHIPLDVVSGLPTAHKMWWETYEIYLSSRLRRNGHSPCVQCKRKSAYFKSMPTAHTQTFSLLPVKNCYSLFSSSVLSRSASKAKIMSHLLMLV